MRRVALALFSTVAGLVMLLSFKTHSVTVAGVPVATGPITPGTSAAGSSGTGPATGSSSAAPSTTPSAAGTPTPAASTPATRTITGDSVDTRFGPVQVQITVQNGSLTAVNAVVYPQDTPRDVEINSYAIPMLNQEASTAKGAQIDMISGATYTSEGYLGSLQSALDKAGL